MSQEPKPEQSEKKPKEPELPPGIQRSSPEEEKFVDAMLESKEGKGLLRVLAPISRRDMHPQNLAVQLVRGVGAIDVVVVAIEKNTPLMSNLLAYLWQNRMAWRWDTGGGTEISMVVRWFLPYELPEGVALPPPSEEKPQPANLRTFSGGVKTAVPPGVKKISKEEAEQMIKKMNEKEAPPTAQEEVGQTKESTLEGPVQRMVAEAVEETVKEMANE